LNKLGFIDFAGGAGNLLLNKVVHVVAGSSALCFSILMKRRYGYRNIWDIITEIILRIMKKPLPPRKS
jgi:ammonia channel protein AmtB